MFLEKPNASLGHMQAYPEQATAGEAFGLTLVYTAGLQRIPAGGCLRFQVPQPCPPPQKNSPMKPGYVCVKCDAAGCEISFERTGHPKDENFVTRFGHSIYVTIVEGELCEGDRLTLYYGQCASAPWGVFGMLPKTAAPFFAGEFPLLMAVDPDGMREAPYSGMYRCTPDVMLKVLHGKPHHTIQFPCRSGIIDGWQDENDNPVGVPALTRAEPEIQGVFFGDMHCHSVFSDGIGSPKACYDFARDWAGLDFCAVTDHAQYLSQAEWDSSCQQANDAMRAGQFVTLCGYELSHPEIGDKNIYYPGEWGPMIPELNLYTGEILDAEETIPVWKAHGALMMAHLHARNLLKFRHPELCRLMEVYSNWGCCEFEGANPPFIPSLRHDFTGNWAQDALAAGLHMGFTANSDDHMGRPGVSGWHRVERTYRSGLTAVLAKELTRPAIFEALYQRHTYATSGVRIYLSFSLNGAIPGDEVMLIDRNMHIALSVHGTAEIKSMEIINVRQCLWRWTGMQERCDMQIELPAENGMYYLRVTQQDGHQAWTSPIYVRKI